MRCGETAGDGGVGGDGGGVWLVFAVQVTKFCLEISHGMDQFGWSLLLVPMDSALVVLSMALLSSSPF